MMQDYDLPMPDTQPDAMTEALPSEQVLKNILGFAQSYQSVELEGMQFDLFLN